MCAKPAKPMHVAFLWHQHQPHYRDLISGEYLMPWVRLHGVKDYLDMVLILEEFPGMKMTVNLVPSLVEQLEEYAAGKAKDHWLRLALRDPATLSREEKVLSLQRFFSAHIERMIRPLPRYAELLEKRGHSTKPEALSEASARFEPRDWLDLQVLFHLSWTDPLLIERDPELQALRAKGRDFTVEDRDRLLEKHRNIIGEIVPAHRRLQKAGQLEVTTTPFYHPILPLLCDSEWAKEARPDIALPSVRFRHPEDAETQIHSALEYMAERLGAPPQGMWPSEGSVCPEIIPMLAQAGVKWIATDEEVLAKSLGIPIFTRDPEGRVNNMDALYRPYTVEVDGHRLNMVFRDHAMSDFIGFHAAGADPERAAEMLVHRLRDARFFLNEAEGSHLVSIILDGENCWEHYADDGLPFLRALYRKICEDDLLIPVRIGEHLEEHPPTHTLQQLHAGSWINHDYRIWIGHEDDNESWDYLSRTRERVSKHIEANRSSLTEEQIAKAWKAIHVAEGSDWNWWYGDDHFSGMDDQFDALYRCHLAAAHRAVGLEPRPDVQRPIIGETPVAAAHIPPRGYVDVHLDGRPTSFFEWASAGHYDPQHGGGSMHRAEEGIQALLYGFSREHLFLRLDLMESVWERVGDQALEVDFLVFEPTPMRLAITLTHGMEPGPREVTSRGLEDSAPLVGDLGAESAWDRVLEVKVPFTALRAERGARLLLQAVIRTGDQEIDRVPAREPLKTKIPDAEWEAQHWMV
jgi:alpha-amylase/alpha-mannosidase (GH57 family)